ncbi:MAG: hypothetical protein ACOY5Y_18245 [Pseudomonadota bacterium]
MNSRLWLALASLALALKILTPPGFMIAAPVNEMPFPLVLCTAQGAMTVEPGAPLGDPTDPGHAPQDGSASDGLCAFAASAQLAGPPSHSEPDPVEFANYERPPERSLTHLAPGRGLAAPPLPARGPPSLLT